MPPSPKPPFPPSFLGVRCPLSTVSDLETEGPIVLLLSFPVSEVPGGAEFLGIISELSANHRVLPLHKLLSQPCLLPLVTALGFLPYHQGLGFTHLLLSC